MSVRRVSPEEARSLLDGGAVYVDVRSEPEFDAGHVPGALNVPWKHRGAGGLRENPDFLAVMQGAFARDASLVVGCQSGGRSLAAAKALVAAGFERVVDLETGFDGSRDAFGRPKAGWRQTPGFPVETDAAPGQRYADVKARAEAGRSP